MEGNGVASGKKNAERLGAHLVFVDESGFLLIPNVRRTWAPRGRTPIIHHRYRHDRLSVISGISVSPHGQRVGLYFKIHAENIRQPHVVVFLRHLLKQLRGHVIVVWDNIRTHGGLPVKDLCRKYSRLHLVRFPAYAPELNPDEGVWAHAKRDLSNSMPLDLAELRSQVRGSLKQLKHSQRHLRSCIHRSDLPSFLS